MSTKNRRRRAAAGIALAALVVGITATTASASIPSGTQFLPTDNFEVDGNKPVNTAGNLDWASPPPNLHTDTDLTKSTSDNSFGQGTKENTPVPTVVSGSIPPNKSDFSEFQIANRTLPNGHTAVYLDWTRSNVLGSADMDFELNQSNQISSNNTTNQRTQGDLLITYDFAQGANNVSVHIATWNGNASSGSWSALTTLNSSQAVGSIADSLEFGELAVDLNAAGIFSSTTCESFASAYLKSRSSDSFTSEMKDFVAPTPVNITNCGRIVVDKVDAANGNLLAGATFSVTPGQVVNGTQQSSSSMTEVANGVFCIDNILANGAQYTVTETAPPPGYDPPNPASQTVTVSNTNSCSGVGASTTPDLTFQDTAKVGAILVNKSAKNKSAAGGTAVLPGAVFRVLKNGLQVGVDQTTDASGQTCFANLPLGSYTLHEVSAPTGYSTAADVTGISVSSSSSCSNNPVTRNVTDIPLSKITVSFQSLAGPGVTTATVQCTGEGSAANLPEGTPKVLTNLQPGTYSCTVVVDP